MFDLLVSVRTSLPPKLQGAFTEAIRRSLTSCRNEVNHYTLCTPHLGCSFYLWGELFGGEDRMEGRAGSDTYLRMCYFTLLLLAKSVAERQARYS